MFKIMGTYNGRTEVIDEFDTKKEADAMLTEYQVAYSSRWTLWVVEP